MTGPEQLIVVCPLEHERRALARRGIAELARLDRCGAGAASVDAWAQRIGPRAGAVVLAGLAGSLRPQAPVGTAMLVTAVHEGADAVTGRPTLVNEHGPEVIVTSAAAAVLSVDERRRLAERTGAALVDLESVAFARSARRLGWRWGIVRGVSDDGSERLPARIGAWVDATGRTRGARVALDVLRRPALIATLRRLHRQSETALDEVAALVRTLCADEHARNANEPDP